MHREAAKWIAEEYARIPGMEVELMEYVMPMGKRVTEPTPAVQVIATLPGETKDVVMMSAHFDSLNLQIGQMESPAPGANDDASGIAATLEVARSLATTQHRNTLRFAGYSGEEQGLLGAKALAERALTERWSIIGILNNDMIGNAENLNGQRDDARVRVFGAQGISRELARIAEYRVRQSMPHFGLKFIARHDRFGRGGDHTPFADAGFAAIRLTEVHEEYSRQHTPNDVPEAIDFDYLTRVAEANRIVLASLASAMPSPNEVRLIRDQSHDTTLEWSASSDDVFEVFWRETASSVWQGCQVVHGGKVCLIRINKDDHFFGVAAVGGIPTLAEGSESP